MYPAPFDYRVPATLPEALAILAEQKDEARVLAGGHSLLPMLKLRLAQPRTLVDLRRLRELFGLSRSGGGLRIGAMTTHWQIESDPLVRRLCPVLCETASVIGDVQVRNRGTIGGSVAHGDPAADYPAVMLALSATMTCASLRGERTVAADRWFTGLMTTALAEDEILTRIEIPPVPPGSGCAYVKEPHPASHFAVVGVAAFVEQDATGVCRAIRVAITGAGTRAVRAEVVERMLLGKPLTPAAIDAACDEAPAACDVQGDVSHSIAYKTGLCRVIARRAIAEAVSRSAASLAAPVR